jgi:hypothetical protein
MTGAGLSPVIRGGGSLVSLRPPPHDWDLPCVWGVMFQPGSLGGSALAVVEYVSSLNRRRHLNSSQALIANARREQMCQVYRAVKEDAKARQRSGKGADGSGGRGRKKNPTERIRGVPGIGTLMRQHGSVPEHATRIRSTSAWRTSW